jgi:hypothetical protein
MRESNFRISQFYGTPKVHKNPIKMRPVVSCINSIPNVMLTWLDHYLQQVLPLCKSYIKDSWDLVNKLNNLGPLPTNTRIYSADATSMYTCIDTDHGIKTVKLWLTKHEHELPAGFPPIDLICSGLELAMKNNVFEYNNTKWLQLQGIAMGTSAACTYATIYFAYHEETILFSKELKPFFYCQKIDDALIIDTNCSDKKYTNFIKALNNFSNGTNKPLEWIPTKPSKSVDFLDLTISINDDNEIITKTYQKPMNLHLYIPPHSAHSSGTLKGLIYGSIRRFWTQNSRTSDYENIVSKFFQHLCERGHNINNLQQLFLQAAEHIKSNTSTSTSKNINGKQVFFHLQYHPRQITRSVIQNLYQKHCHHTFSSSINNEGKIVPIKKLTIAYHRAKTIRNIVNKIKLTQPVNQTVQDIINQRNSLPGI